jgi:hypothetical protein
MWIADQTQRKFRKLHRHGLGLACLALLSVSTALSGCKFFDLGNPLLPKARPVAFPEPSLVNVVYTLQQETNIITVEAEDVVVRVQSLFNDASPGVIFQTYTAEYFDLSGLSIAPLLLSKVNLGVTAYLPPASAQQPADIEVRLPVYNQQVREYGVGQVFDRTGLNRNLIHTINCRVTLGGIDDNFNEIEIPFNVPIRFEGNIQP